MTGPTDGERQSAVIVRAWLLGWAAAVAEQRTWLTDLDAAIGDGDLGVTVGDGSLAAAAALSAVPPDATPAVVLRTVGMTLARANPSTFSALAMGALVAAAKDLGDEADVGFDAGLRAARAAADSIATRGKSAVGDKTVLDALVPSLDAAAAAPDVKLEIGQTVHAALTPGRVHLFDRELGGRIIH